MAEAQTAEADGPVARAAELRPLLARNVAQAEKDRRLPSENVEALQSANLFKVMVPRRWGGYGATLPEAMSTFAELAKDCPSTGWVAMIINGVSWWASRLPDRGQEEIFASTMVRAHAPPARQPGWGAVWTAEYAFGEISLCVRQLPRLMGWAGG